MHLAWNNSNSNKQYCLHIKQKHYQFSSKNPSSTKNSPQSNFYYMDFFLNFLFEYSFIGIVKLKFTRRNEMWCRILDIEALSKKVRKTQDRMSLIHVHVFYFVINCLHHRYMQFIIGGSMGGLLRLLPPPIQFQKIEKCNETLKQKKNSVY